MTDKELLRKLTPKKFPFDPDAPVREELQRLGFVDLRTFSSDYGNVRSERTKVRYLAALLPDLELKPLAEAVAAIISNDDLSVDDVRVILDGYYLNDPSKRTSEVPLQAIQKVGKLLAGGSSLADAAREARVSIDTVESIDAYLGLTQVVEDRLMDLAVTAVREGWSVSKLAASSGMSRSRAHRYLVRARGVLVEIGEVA
jgi:hypothetical protein